MEIHKKIEKWIIATFGNVNRAAVQMKMHSITLYNYTKGENLPGTPFYLKMKQWGCDMNWLFSEKDEGDGSPSLLAEADNLRKENKELKERMDSARLLLERDES